MSNETLVFLAFHFGGQSKRIAKQTVGSWQSFFSSLFVFLWDLLVDIKSLILSKGSRFKKLSSQKPP